ncbi:MAG: hypothetical protein K2I00_09290 [Ruminococcus sp.]|nr:hypothetical protein [Ruminococcus sp.]
MKKTISLISSAVLLYTAVSSPVVINSYAEDYIPLVYMRTHENSAVTIEPDGTAVIDRNAITDGFTLTADIFIRDDSKKCWFVSPKWKCRSEYIKLNNIVVPEPHAYTEKDGQNRTGTSFSIKENINVATYTCKVTDLYDRSEMIPYGENTDDYPLVTFDMTISPDIPDGTYEIYFLSEVEDAGINKESEIAMRNDSQYDGLPEMESLFIRIGENSLQKGDIGGDGKIDATDATDVLVEYSRLSTNQPSGFTAEQTYAADIDNDGKIDSSDASFILTYYAYLSTKGDGETIPIEEYIKNNNS